MTSTRYAILACVVTLMCIGMVAVYSGGASLSGAEDGELHQAQKQMIFMLTAAVVMVIFAQIDYHRYEKVAGWILIGALMALIAVCLLGATLNRAQRWINIGSYSIQPSEFFKIALVIYMARFLNAKQQKIREFLHGLLPPLILISFSSALIVLQPDFGTALLTAAVAAGMTFIAGVSLLQAIPVGLTLVPLIAYVAASAPYRMRRLLIFWDPWQDPHGDGFQVIQSLISFGAGGLTGTGPGFGMQKNGFMPYHLSDFIFTVIGEEAGFIGAVTVVLIYAVLLYLGVRVIRRAADGFGSLLAFGIMLTIALQALINMGVVLSMLPTKGLPLPFISAGGSSTIAMSIGIGVVMNIASQADQDAVALPGAARAGI